MTVGVGAGGEGLFVISNLYFFLIFATTSHMLLFAKIYYPCRINVLGLRPIVKPGSEFSGLLVFFHTHHP